MTSRFMQKKKKKKKVRFRSGTIYTNKCICMQTHTEDSICSDWVASLTTMTMSKVACP